MMTRAVLFVLALAAGNFLWQAISGAHDWGAALERSYSQCWAVLWFAYRMRRGTA